MLKKFLWMIALTLLVFPAAAEEMTADALIEKNIDARGGRDAWDDVKSARIDARMMMGGSMEVPVTLYFQRPGKVRIEIEMQGQKIVQAYDGTSGWQIMPLMGITEPQKMSDDESKSVKRQSELEGPLFDYKEKGHQVELLGKADVEGTETYKLKLTLDGGDEVYTYLDAEHFLELKQESSMPAMGGQEVKTQVMVGDYKEVGDLVLAHSLDIMPEGAPQGMSMTFDKVEINPDGVDDALFAMPEAPAEKPAANGGR